MAIGATVPLTTQRHTIACCNPAHPGGLSFNLPADLPAKVPDDNRDPDVAKRKVAYATANGWHPVPARGVFFQSAPDDQSWGLLRRAIHVAVNTPGAPLSGNKSIVVGVQAVHAFWILAPHGEDLDEAALELFAPSLTAYCRARGVTYEARALPISGWGCSQACIGAGLEFWTNERAKESDQ